MPKLLRNEWLLWVGVALMFAGMLWGILAIQGSEVRAFRNEGREASATVVDKFTTRSSSTDSREYNFEVTYMAKDADNEDATSVQELGDFDFSIDVGTFSRARFTVGAQTYDDTEIGDEVRIYYLPEDTTEAELKSWVDEYNPIFLQGAIWFFVATAVLCLIAAPFAPKTRDADPPQA
ncbi:MAG: DUF3592 domain-containing protein [Ardenticatenaceae bacterium]|nr:DUF3592 domain-containing protein [Anaerolineales bacterium]MCB8939492.1 DUF3592 domain-containing protein [Ardenticatenaceae bacterium]MCB8975708.1 DUF3592 domain-containing protein [Ardenticatenaceae bacterium]